MNVSFTQEELNKIMDILANLPIRHISVVQDIQKFIQQKYMEEQINAEKIPKTDNVTSLP
jgi:hypothetical protein